MPPSRPARRFDGPTLLLERELTEWLPPGRKIYTVSRLGTPPVVELLIASGPDVLRIGWEVAELLGLPYQHDPAGILLLPDDSPEALIAHLADTLHRDPATLQQIPV